MSYYPNSTFSVKTPSPSFINALNTLPHEVIDRTTNIGLGNTGTAIPTSYLVAGNVFISPTGVGNVYTLPTAAQILATFGQPLGVPNLQPNDVLIFHVINNGLWPAAVVTSTTGGDGSAVWCQPASATGVGSGGYTGALGLGHGTPVYIQITAVSPGNVTNGLIVSATGSYTIYS